MSGSYARVEVKEPAAGWFGVGEESRMAARVDAPGFAGAAHAAGEAARGESKSRGWKRLAKRALIDLAIVMALIVSVPVCIVALSNGAIWRPGMEYASTRARMVNTEPMRRFTVPVDASITPLEAGRSLLALQDKRQPRGEFLLQDVVRPLRPWNSLRLNGDMFGGAFSHAYNGPNESTILESAARGLSDPELAYLRTFSTGAVWRDFDRVARAPAIDPIGGKFQTPFQANATYPIMPVPSFAGNKELAYAAVSRAAYHLAIGQKDSAEAVLRSIVSFGFNYSDNGSTVFEQIVGRVIVSIGRDALGRFYTLTKDPRAAEVIALEQAPSGSAAVPEVGLSARNLSVPQMRQLLLARAADPHELRGIRWESLEMLSLSSCTNVRELLFGQRQDVRDAFVRARTELARYPSELALLDLMQRQPTAKALAQLGQTNSLFVDVMGGTSVIAGAALGNPRLPACMLINRLP